jgi:hypothetical protein
MVFKVGVCVFFGGVLCANCDLRVEGSIECALKKSTFLCVSAARRNSCLIGRFESVPKEQRSKSKTSNHCKEQTHIEGHCDEHQGEIQSSNDE